MGGTVRDQLLGLPTEDTDWVVVGATPQQMLERGFKPVGKDFPVFLHPHNHDEYALARTERKTAPGYRGFAVHFAPDVTLAEDLSRRDLTINAMAMDAQGRLIDPHHGKQDLDRGIFRHVSEAFTEDPVRILRIARFASRFDRFAVADETVALMRTMVHAGEVDALVAERVWQELARALMERHPHRFFEVLADCGALERLLPGLEAGERLRSALDRAVRADLGLASRFALLCADGGSGWCEPNARRLRAPNECREAGIAFERLITRLPDARCGLRDDPPDGDSRAVGMRTLGVLEALEGFRRPQRMLEALDAYVAWAGPAAQPLREWLLKAARAAGVVDAGAIAGPLAQAGGEAIRAAVAQARARAIEALKAGP